MSITAAELERANHELRSQVAGLQKAVESLRDSEASYRLLFESNPHAMWVFDSESLRFLQVNEAAIQQYGYTRDEFLALTIKDIRPEEDIPHLLANLSRQGSGLDHAGVWRHRRKDGSILCVEIISHGLQFRGRPATLVLAVDVTERERAQEGLKHSDLRFRTLFERAPDAMYLHDLQGTFVDGNRAAEEMVGYSKDELIGKSFLDLKLLPEEDRSRAAAGLQCSVEGLATGPAEFNLSKKDGTIVPVEIRTFPLKIEDQPLVLGVARDLTERKRAEAEKRQLQHQLLRAQRLESIGTLAAGIAHDLNNILSPIMLSAQLLADGERTKEEAELLATIQASAQRGANIIKQVLTYARGTDGRRVPVQPKYLLKEMEKIVAETFPRDIEFRLIASRELWTVSGDATQLHQVLMNLCVNARDAMPKGGILELSAENVHVAEQRAGLFQGGKAGPHVLIRVHDTGHGIPPAIAEKIFDPFFTTKEPGKGTGLGLSTALGIVRSHGGFIDLETESGRGSMFKVYLPACPGKQEGPASGTTQLVPRGNGECVLIVDDEVGIRSVTKRALDNHGYEVLLAADGKEALELAADYSDKLKVIVTDVMMPVMGGLQFVEKIRAWNPRLAVIVCTGMGQEGVRPKLEALGVTHFLQKPFSASELLEVIRTCLGHTE